MKQKFNVITSTCVPLPLENVDTDQIIPARFLKASANKPSFRCIGVSPHCCSVMVKTFMYISCDIADNTLIISNITRDKNRRILVNVVMQE